MRRKTEVIRIPANKKLDLSAEIARRFAPAPKAIRTSGEKGLTKWQAAI